MTKRAARLQCRKAWIAQLNPANAIIIASIRRQPTPSVKRRPTPPQRRNNKLSIWGDTPVNDGPTAETARPKLFQPFTIRGLTLRNRLVVPPMVHYRAEHGATCGSFHMVHLGRYALGGFGLVFVEATGVEEIGLINEHDLGLWNDAQVESFKPLIAFMHRQN